LLVIFSNYFQNCKKSLLLKILHSYQTVLPEGISEAYVAIENGRISWVAKQLPANTHHPIVALGDSVLMPGVIDPHVHINEPGRTSWEGFDTATKAAIAGGITTLVDMPLNSAPVTTTPDAFEQKLAAANHKLHTNVGFWGGLVPGNHQQIEPLIKKGVLGFKAFLTHSGIDDFPNVAESDLHLAMPIIAKYGLPLLVHCELTDNLVRATGHPASYQNYLASRPKEWEDNAIAMMIRLCEQYQCRVHVVHLSSANSIAPLQQAKAKGLPISVETAQHYLYFNAESIPDGQTPFKCAPPIREKSNNDQLWTALQQGIIDLVATDHSPATPDLKEIASGNLLKAWGGIASIQLALPILWTAARQRGYTLSQLVNWLCVQPAQLAGLTHRKGRIVEGMDADFTVLAANEAFTVQAQHLYHKHKVSPYIGERLYGVVKQTWLNGQLVFDNQQHQLLNQGTIITHAL
jgi:allantoinase